MLAKFCFFHVIEILLNSAEMLLNVDEISEKLCFGSQKSFAGIRRILPELSQNFKMSSNPRRRPSTPVKSSQVAVLSNGPEIGKATASLSRSPRPRV